MWEVLVIFISISMLMLLVRTVIGPTTFDRILAANIFSTNVVILIAVIAFADDEKDYIDIALVYALLNFVATIGYLRFFKYGSFKGDFAKDKNKITHKASKKKTKA